MRPRTLARTIRRCLLAAMLATGAAPAPAEIAVSLAPADPQDPDAAPFRVARLTIDAADAEEGLVVRAVRLREARGGPTFVHAVTVAAGTKHTLDVSLPAVSQEQRYVVELLADDAHPAEVLARATAKIHWPQEQVTDLAFLDPQAYEPWLEELPTWPAALRRTVFVVLALACLAASAAALIRTPALRAAALVLVAAVATTVAARMLQRAETIVRREADDGDLIVLRCRRTAVWRTRETRLVPIYFNAWHMRQDNMVVRVGREIRLELSPRPDARRVRLFRRRKPDSG